jgi:hypothetical protein
MTRISIDLDGVLSDFMTAAIDVTRRLHPGKIPDDYICTKYHFADLPKGVFDSVFKDMLASENLWMKMPVLEENVEALRNHVDEHGGGLVHFLTCRSPSTGYSTEKQTKLWLSINGLPDKNVHVVESSGMKQHFLREMGIPWSLDDLPSTVEECLTIPDHNARLLDTSYNRHVDLPRVKSVAEFLKEVY